jgi:hypothetical protein
MVLLPDILLHVTLSSSLDHPVKFNYKLSQNPSPPIFFVFSSYRLLCPHHSHSSVTVTVRCHETNKRHGPVGGTPPCSDDPWFKSRHNVRLACQFSWFSSAGLHKSRGTKFCTAVPNIFSKVLQFFHQLQFTGIGQRSSDNSEGHRSLQKCGPAIWSWVRISHSSGIQNLVAAPVFLENLRTPALLPFCSYAKLSRHYLQADHISTTRHYIQGDSSTVLTESLNP